MVIQVKGKGGGSESVAAKDAVLKPRTRTSRKGSVVKKAYAYRDFKFRCVCVVCRYAQLNDDQFESLLSGEKSYEELVKPENSKTDNKL